MKYKILLYIFFLFLIAGCEIKEDYCPKFDSTIKSLPDPSIKEVNIFIDASGSMSGFMSKYNTTDFQLLIPDIITELETEFNGKINIYPIYDSKEQMKKSSSVIGIQDTIISGSLTKSNGNTYIPIMLDSIYRGYFRPNAVNIFISDLIYDPKSEEKKKAEQATREIRQGIKNYTKEYSTSVFCLFSKFNELPKSPYYLIVFGKPENNHQIENIIENTITRKNQNYHQINFGLQYDKPFYSVLPYTNISPSCIANPCPSLKDAYANIVVNNFKSENDSVTFWIGLNLKKLPDYAKTKNYLDSNLELTLQKVSAQAVEITTSVPNGLNKDDKGIADSSTHFVRINVSSIEESASTINLRLKYSRPEWILDLDQTDSTKNGERTFGLERIVKGFEEAYDQDKPTYFLKDIIISIIKN